MKIKGWCGWNLGPGEEVAFERLRSSLGHWRWWPSLKTYRWRRRETVGQDGRQISEATSSSSETLGGHGFFQLYQRDRQSLLLVLRPVHFLPLLISKHVLGTRESDTPSASLSMRKRRTITLSMIDLFKVSATKVKNKLVSPHSESSVFGCWDEATSSTDQKKK